MLTNVKKCVQMLILTNVFRCPVSSVRCPVSGVRCPAYGVRRTVSGVQCPAYGVWRTVSGVRCPAYSVRRLSQIFLSEAEIWYVDCSHKWKINQGVMVGGTNFGGT